MDDSISNGQCQLIDKVISRGICVTCGACVGLCPYFDYFDGKVVVLDRCQSDTWRCLQICPRADYADTSLVRIPENDQAKEIGPFQKIFMARSKKEEISQVAQYGGIVSTLLIYAMEKGFIESAIITDKGDGISSAGKIARNKSDILNCAGSRYNASGVLAALNRAIKEDVRKLAVVGLPCQMEALARMGLMEPDGEERCSRINLKIGLFCTWALDYRQLNEYLKNVGLEEPIIKYDIPPPPSQVFLVQTEKGWREFPLDDIRPFIQKGCALCGDMTAEHADISVGSVEGVEGWNTVVVRSQKGEEIMATAFEDNQIQIDDLPKENLDHLKEASLNKRERSTMADEEMKRRGS